MDIVTGVIWRKEMEKKPEAWGLHKKSPAECLVIGSKGPKTGGIRTGCDEAKCQRGSPESAVSPHQGWRRRQSRSTSKSASGISAAFLTTRVSFSKSRRPGTV